MESAGTGRNSEQSLQHHALSFEIVTDSVQEEDEEWQLRGAEIEKLPTFKRLRTSLSDDKHDSETSKRESEGKRMVDVTKLSALERSLIIQRLIKRVENDNLQLLQKLRERTDRYYLTKIAFLVSDL